MNPEKEASRSGPRRESPNPGTLRLLFALALLLTAAAAAGCSGDANPPEPAPVPEPCQTPENYRLPFQLEYRIPGTMTFSLCGKALEGTLILEKGFNVLRAGVPYAGKGTFFTFPESGHRLYTWTIPATGVDPATCPEGKATLSLSLSTREDWQTLSGGLTAYCGDGTNGRRPLKVMRLSGPLERTEEP
jgi:hypothetical protein